MGLCVKHVLVQRDKVVGRKQKEKILQGLCKEERLAKNTYTHITKNRIKHTHRSTHKRTPSAYLHDVSLTSWSEDRLQTVIAATVRFRYPATGIDRFEYVPAPGTILLFARDAI